MNVANFSRKQTLLCRGNQRFRGKNAEGLLGLPRFFFSTLVTTARKFLLRPCNNFIKLPEISGKEPDGENIRPSAPVNPRWAELTFRYNLGMHVEA